MPAMLLILQAFSCFATKRHRPRLGAAGRAVWNGYLPGMGRFNPTTGGFQVSSKAWPKFGRAGR